MFSCSLVCVCMSIHPLFVYYISIHLILYVCMVAYAARACVFLFVVSSMLSLMWWSSLARSLLPCFFFLPPFLLKGVSHPIAVVLLCLILRQ